MISGHGVTEITLEKLVSCITSEPGVSGLPEKKIFNTAVRALKAAEFFYKIRFLEITGISSAEILLESISIKSKIIAGLFNNTSAGGRALVFCVTLGNAFDEISLSESTDLTESFLFDIAGSCMLSYYLDRLSDNLKSDAGEIKRDLIFSKPVMPGSCGWDLEKGLGSLYDELMPDDIFVHLKDGMMTPKKSMIGVFFESEALRDVEPCGWCDRPGLCCKSRFRNKTGG